MAKQTSKAKIAKRRGRASKKQEPKQIHRVSRGISKKGARSHRPEQIKLSPSEKSCLLRRANKIAKELKHPRFVKVMLKSHVTGGFWLGLPANFCRRHMGSSDLDITLENEAGEEFTTKYLGEKGGLSAGWRGFSIQNNVLEGYVLVFDKVGTHKFKVNVVKPNSPKQVKFSPAVVAQRAVDNEMPVDTETSSLGLSEDLLSLMGDDDDGSTGDKGVSSYIDDFEDNNDVVVGVGRPESAATTSTRFEEVTCLEKFKVMFNGKNISSQIPKPVLKKYYELCRRQSSHMHQNVIESLDSQLVVGLICETVNIADAIKSCKITAKEREFETWDKTLQASEMIGMNVGFMRSRVRRLASLARESLQVAARFENVIITNL